MFTQPNLNTQGVGRILESFENRELRIGFAKLSRVLLTPVVFR